MIRIEKVSHSYKKRTALKDVTFAVNQGELFALLGPNGSGKSTLFKLLSTLIPPQEGNIYLNEIHLNKHASLARHQLGVVFQNPSLDDKLTVHENLMHQGHLYGLSGALLDQRIDHYLNLVGTYDRSKDIVSTLSGGLKRRVEIAKSLLHQPKILFLDEPSTGLDPTIRQHLMEFYLELAHEQKMTILLTTHLLEEADNCDRVAILNEGSLIALDTPANLKQSVGYEIIQITSAQKDTLAKAIEAHLGKTIITKKESLELHCTSAESKEITSSVIEKFHSQIETITLRKPSLGEVYALKTGSDWNKNNE
jgi:ABC-2 type transport system ATP-binding protein